MISISSHEEIVNEEITFRIKKPYLTPNVLSMETQNGIIAKEHQRMFGIDISLPSMMNRGVRAIITPKEEKNIGFPINEFLIPSPEKIGLRLNTSHIPNANKVIFLKCCPDMASFSAYPKIIPLSTSPNSLSFESEKKFESFFSKSISWSPRLQSLI